MVRGRISQPVHRWRIDWSMVEAKGKSRYLLTKAMEESAPEADLITNLGFEF